MNQNVTENITLTCAAIGIPIPTITWTYNGSTINITSYADITVVTTPTDPGHVSSTITILTVASNNTGYYACKATSSVEFYDTVMSEQALVLIQGISINRKIIF